jgi:hypothetical protein
MADNPNPTNLIFASFQFIDSMVYSTPEIRTVNVTRYVTPLREGGSLPAIAEADDDFLYVIKFRGAGQGVKALIADLLGAEIARALGLKVPEMVFANLDEAFGRTEPDEEIQDLLKASVGLNLGVHYLSRAITYDPAVEKVDQAMASVIVWLDSLLMNVDRTARNTNMLVWQKQLWLIDHGASLYFHHSWTNWEEQAVKPFTQVKDHVLLPRANDLEETGRRLAKVLRPKLIEAIVNLVPAEWLKANSFVSSANEGRKVYIEFLNRRVAASDIFVKEALYARKSFV